MTVAVAERPARTPDTQKQPTETSYQYPGIPTTCDGAEAVVHVEVKVCQAAGAYPITSSTTMGGGFNASVMNGAKNLWGDTLMFFEPESEHSAAAVCEGFAVAGGRVTNFTSGQGLVLMKEVLYTISGKRLPVVMNIGARALTSQGLNVHAGHDDVMSVADCGWGMIFARNAQEASDMCLIARRAAEASFTPFFSVQDGFLTTHTVETVLLSEKEFMMPYRCEDADYIIVGMGCYMETAQSTVDYLRKEKGVKVGCLNVVCFRPFPMVEIVEALKNCKAFAVLERMDDPLSTTGNHLTREIKAAFCDAANGQNGQEKLTRIPQIYNGSAGLGSRDVRPGDLIAVVENMIEEGQDYFCVGIDHALALKVTDDPDLRGPGTFSMRGHSIGGFGSVTTNKVIATIGGDVFGKDVQAYPKYGSEKKGLPTTYYLTISNNHILLHSEPNDLDLVVLNDTTALFSGNPLVGLVKGGSVIMQSIYTEPADVWQRIPEHHKRTIQEKKIRVFYADMVQIARE